MQLLISFLTFMLLSKVGLVKVEYIFILMRNVWNFGNTVLVQMIRFYA